MFNAIAMLVALVGPGLRPQQPMDEVCELVNAIPGRTPTSSCLGCHDGTVGPLASVTMRGTQEIFEGASGLRGGEDHPVDFDYAAAVDRRPGSLAPISALPPQLLLLNGQMTCMTCHHPDSPERFRVSLSVDRSALCLACHLY